MMVWCLRCQAGYMLELMYEPVDQWQVCGLRQGPTVMGCRLVAWGAASYLRPCRCACEVTVWGACGQLVDTKKSQLQESSAAPGHQNPTLDPAAVGRGPVLGPGLYGFECGVSERRQMLLQVGHSFGACCTQLSAALVPGAQASPLQSKQPCQAGYLSRTCSRSMLQVHSKRDRACPLCRTCGRRCCRCRWTGPTCTPWAGLPS